MTLIHYRHPRFTIALLVLIFISFLLFANSAWHDSLVDSVGFHRMYRDDLAELVKIEEAYYQKMLDERRDFILKTGPTPDKINPFPGADIFYTIWDFLLPAFKCPHHRARVGVLGDGGKWVCGLERIIPKESCIIYSIGINDESSFEADMLKAAPSCEVYGYDFSVNSFGPQIELEPDLKRRSHFFSYALGSKDAFGPLDNPKTYTLRTLMEQNGHDFIDVLKIDVEGAEFDSIEVFVDSFQGEPLPFGQLQVELHLAFDRVNPNIAKVLKWWEKLEGAGLRPFFSELNMPHVSHLRTHPTVMEYSFINIRGNHELISDRPKAPSRRVSSNSTS